MKENTVLQKYWGEWLPREFWAESFFFVSRMARLETLGVPALTLFPVL
jgi:hypothetical protein